MTGVASHASGADAGRSWWRVWRIAIAIAAATAVAVVAFTYRYNALEGTRGGLENDHVAHLMRTDMLLQGEQPLRDFAAAEPRGAWPSLSYAVPAWAQTLGGRTLLPEAYLTVGAGTILVDEEPRFRVFVETDRQPCGVDAYFWLPCFR